MGSKPLYEGQQFTVKEEKALNFIMAILNSGIAAVGIGMIASNGFKEIGSEAVLLVFLVPGIVFFKKALSKQVYIRINKTGIYYFEKLLTDWPHFLKANVGEGEKKKLINISDKFELIIEYTKDDPTKGFRKKIPLHNTQNQSEEDILTAIKYFWHLYANEKGLFGTGIEKLRAIS